MHLTSTNRARGWIGLVVAGWVALGSAAPAQADSGPTEGDLAQARELLQQGVDLRAHGDNVAALERLRAAHALVRTPITGLELGKTYLALGRLVEAREVFLSVGRIPVRVEETQRSRDARSESEALSNSVAPRIPRLRIAVTGVPPETVGVAIDGSTVPTEALAAPRFVNPGHHTVLARSTTGATTETSVDLTEGETRDVELKIVLTGGNASEPAMPAAAPTAATHSIEQGGPGGSSHSRALEWSLLGGGAAVGIAGGALMGIAAVQSRNANDNRDRSASDSAKTLWTVGLATTVVGSLAFVSGGVVFFARPNTSDKASRARISVRTTVAGGYCLMLEGAW